MKKKYDAVILCGGFGKRLGKLTKYTPKPLLKVLKKPFLFFLLKNLERFKIKNVILLTYYKSESFKKFLSKYRFENIHLFKERKKLGTGGSVINILNKLNENFYVFNGDTLFDFNYIDLKINLKNSQCLIAGTKTKKKNTYNYKFNRQKIIKEIEIKKNNKVKIISGGVIYANKKLFENLPAKKKLDLDKDIIWPKILKNKIAVKIYKNDFHDIGENYYKFYQSSKFIKKVTRKPCCYLDRDGVINVDKGYVGFKRDFVWKKGVKKAIKFLNDNNYLVIVITNQAGVAHGYYKEKDIKNIHGYIDDELRKIGAHIDHYYFSPFHPNAKIKKYKKNSNYRKPNSGMLKKSFKDYQIDKFKSFFIGDRDTDEMCAKKENITFFYYKNSLYKQVKDILKKLN